MTMLLELNGKKILAFEISSCTIKSELFVLRILEMQELFFVFEEIQFLSLSYLAYLCDKDRKLPRTPKLICISALIWSN